MRGIFVDKKRILIIVTGRGIGGDAGTALNVYNALEKLNVYNALEKRGYDCEIALDESAPGLLFKKNNIGWNKVIIPQAGGHSATIMTTIKAGIRAIRGVIQTRKLLKSKKFDLELDSNHTS